MVGELAEIIKRRSEARTFKGPKGETRVSDLIFFRKGGKPVKDFDKAWRTACEAAGLKAGRKVEGGKIFHDTRRSAATFLERSGVSREVCKQITGHLTNIMFERYVVTTQKEHLAAGLMRRQEYLEKLPAVNNVVPFQKAVGGESK